MFTFGTKLKAKTMNEAATLHPERFLLYPMLAAGNQASPSGPTFGFRREQKIEQKPGPGHYRTMADDRMQWQAVSFKGGRQTGTGPRMGSDSPGPANYNVSCSTLGVAGKSNGCEQAKGRDRQRSRRP